jgi:hypothetical protein
MGEKCGSDMGGEMVVETTPTSPVLAMVLVQQKNSLLKMYVYMSFTYSQTFLKKKDCCVIGKMTKQCLTRHFVAPIFL